MLKLYYSPGACSLAVHIMLRDKNLDFDLKKVSLSTHQVEDGTELASINPKGYVPVLVLENGQILTEVAAILSYIAPPNGDDFARYKMQEWLTFISSELHKGFAAFFNKKASEDYTTMSKEKLAKRFNYVESILAKSDFLIGNEFCAADAYMFTILRWLKFVNTGLPINSWPHIDSYFTKLSQRPAIKAALAEEGLRA